MLDFIEQASRSLGLSPEVTRNATGHLLGLLRDKAGASTLAPLLAKIPGAEQLLQQVAGAPPAATGGGGLLGGLIGGAASALGAQVGGLAGLGDLAATLQKAGIGIDQAAPLVAKLVAYLREKAGAGVVDAVLAKVPELQRLAG